MTDAGFLPSSLPELCNDDIGQKHMPRIVYTINSNRSRMQIIYDYAAVHDLSARQVEALVRELPGGSADVICLNEKRPLLRKAWNL